MSALHDNRDGSHNRDVSLPKHCYVRNSNNRSPLVSHGVYLGAAAGGYYKDWYYLFNYSINVWNIDHVQNMVTQIITKLWWQIMVPKEYSVE